MLHDCYTIVTFRFSLLFFSFLSNSLIHCTINKLIHFIFLCFSFIPPYLDYICEDLEKLAMRIIKDQTSLTGVQPKLSLHLNEHEGSQRLTVVGLWGGFICKPQTIQFDRMPETSSMPKMDVVNFFEVILFSWITGNNDMHLKNFSLFELYDGNIRLTPAYDMLNAIILNPKDDEELALTLNGKKKKLERSDFITSGLTMGVEHKTIERLIGKYVKLLPEMKKLIGNSFLYDEVKHKYLITSMV